MLPLLFEAALQLRVGLESASSALAKNVIVLCGGYREPPVTENADRLSLRNIVLKLNVKKVSEIHFPLRLSVPFRALVAGSGEREFF